MDGANFAGTAEAKRFVAAVGGVVLNETTSAGTRRGGSALIQAGMTPRGTVHMRPRSTTSVPPLYSKPLPVTQRRISVARQRQIVYCI